LHFSYTLRRDANPRLQPGAGVLGTAFSEKVCVLMLGIDANSFIIISAAFGLLCAFLFFPFAWDSRRPSPAWPNGDGGAG
jgi:hypothetical protein